MNLTFEITEKFGKTNYTTGWWVSYPGVIT